MNLRLDLVVPAVVIFLLLGAAIEAAYLIYIARISRAWPTAPGRVVSVLIETRRGSDGARSFRPTVDYRYQVKGVDYEGSRIDLTYDLWMARYYACFTTQGAARVLDGYVPGCPVAVYYKPNHPEYSLLKPGASWSLYIVGGTMILAIVVFAGIWNFLAPF